MDKKEVKEKPEKPAEPVSPPVSNEAMAERLELAAGRLEAANKAALQLRTLAEAERTEATLAGTADASVIVPKTEITDKEYADKVMAGEVPGKT